MTKRFAGRASGAPLLPSHSCQPLGTAEVAPDQSMIAPAGTSVESVATVALSSVSEMPDAVTRSVEDVMPE